MAIGTCTPRARDLSQMAFSAIFRDARGQSLQCEQRDESLRAIRSISVRACVECGKGRRSVFLGLPIVARPCLTVLRSETLAPSRAIGEPASLQSNASVTT